MIVSWVTVEEPGSSKVLYWSEHSNQKKQAAEGKVVTYKFFNYTSGYIHHCNITDLKVVNFFISLRIYDQLLAIEFEAIYSY